MSWHTPFSSDEFLKRAQVVAAGALDGDQPFDAAVDQLARILAEWFNAFVADQVQVPQRFARLGETGRTFFHLEDLHPGFAPEEEPRLRALLDAALERFPDDPSVAADDGAAHDHGDVQVASAGAAHVHPSASGSPVVVHNHNAADAPSGDGPAAHDHAGTPATDGPHVHDAAACHPTPAQQAAADKLIADTKAALPRWNDQNRAMADGYIQYPPVPAGWAQHYVNFSWLDDGRVMDPRHPESLLYAMTDQGYRPISALYILPHASSQPPDTLGCLGHWHEHPEIFLSRPGENGSPPMLHVFIVPMRGGPFAHEPDPQSVRNLYTPFRLLVNPWYRDGCEGAPWLPGDPYQVIPSCQGWQDGHPAGS